VAFSSDSAWVADAAEDATIVVRDARTGKVISKSADYAGRILAIAFSPAGRYIAVAGSDATVTLSDAGTGRVIWIYHAHTGGVTGIAFSPDGKGLATAGSDGTATLLDARTGKILWAIEGSDNQALLAVAFSPDGRFVAGGGADAAVNVWEAQTGKLIWSAAEKAGAVSSIAYSPDGKSLAAILANGTAVILDATTGRRLWGTDGEPEKVVRAVAFSPDSSSVAIAGADATVVLWQVRTAKAIWRSADFTGPVSSVAFTPDSKRLASASADGIVLLLDAGTRERIWMAAIGSRRLLSVENDYEISCDVLGGGLAIWCSEAVAEQAANDKPVCSVTLNVPYLPGHSTGTAAALTAGPAGFLPIVLAAQTVARNNAIIWIPRKAAQEWLKDPPFVDGKLLARLTLKANFVWAASDPGKCLDGDAFGVTRGELTAIRWPTGDGKAGGDFEMWFWVTPPPGSEARRRHSG
jgi:outer membrane protein assembly factor BamB